MNYKILFTTKADADIEDAFNWYENQKQFLGWELRDELSNCIDKIMNDKVDYQMVTDCIHKLRLNRFPYSLYYIKDLHKKQVTILALFHSKRNPLEIKELLKL